MTAIRRHTGLFEEFRNILSAIGGDLTTVNHREFNSFLEQTFEQEQYSRSSQRTGD